MPAAGGAIIGGNVVTGLIGMQAQQAGQAAAAQARQQALQEYLNIHVPDPAKQQIILQKFATTGQLDPQMEQAVSQRATELAKTNVSPAGRSAEVDALQEMTNVAHSGGMDAQARQTMEQGLQTANANERGQIGAIEQNAAARGQGGSGVQLAAELQSTQNDANASANAGMSAASGAEQRALQAMTAEGQLGSNLNNQDYTQAAQKAEAQDAINRFNTQNQQGVANTNVQNTNSAAAANLANKQSVANANVGVSNQQEIQNKGLYQQQFNNELNLASGKANAENGVASGATAAGNSTAKSWANIGSAVGQGVAAISKDSKSNDNTDNEDTWV